jgi:hypothetical protein
MSLLKENKEVDSFSDRNGVHLVPREPRRKRLDGSRLAEGEYEIAIRQKDHIQEGSSYAGGVVTREGAAQVNMNREKERLGIKLPFEKMARYIVITPRYTNSKMVEKSSQS